MFIVIGNFDIYDHTGMQWPICDDAGAVVVFSSVNDAHEYMRVKFNGKVQVFDKASAIAGVGKFVAPREYGEPTEGAYYISRCKQAQPAAQQKPEPEPELDPYDGMTPADFYGECR